MAVRTNPPPAGPGLIASTLEHARTLKAPYYLVLVGVLGGITTVFVVVILLLVMVTANFNILSLIE